MEHERRPDVEREETGRKGGAASMAAGRAYPAESAYLSWLEAPVTRWGPVWAGLVIALGIQFVLSALGAALALSAYDVTSPNFAQDVSVFLSIWIGISLLIALFVGGWIAGRGGALLGMTAGWLQGTVVWALAVIFSLIVGGAITGNLLRSVSNVVPALAGGGAAPQIGAVSVDMQAARAAVTTASTTAWIFFIGAILQWAAAALGGWLGASRTREEA
ncbi:MAG: hypothetical protein ACYC2Y_03280 [Armatimonadota bacterium]